MKGRSLTGLPLLGDWLGCDQLTVIVLFCFVLHQLEFVCLFPLFFMFLFLLNYLYLNPRLFSALLILWCGSGHMPFVLTLRLGKIWNMMVKEKLITENTKNSSLQLDRVIRFVYI